MTISSTEQRVLINKDEITEIDIETSNICNLHCPLCFGQRRELSHAFSQKWIDFSKVKSILDEFCNLDTISICGDASEPTLHPQLIDFLDYMKNEKPNLFVELYTNGSTHSNEYWKHLGRHFTAKSSIIFTICGITQRTHSTYRVGSCLKDVISNALAFKDGSTYRNDYIKYIRFEYNRHESSQDIMKVLSMFSSYEIVDTDPIEERFQFNDEYIACNKVHTDKIFQFKYARELNRAKQDTSRRYCHNYTRRLLKMDNDCNLYPCIMFRLYNPRYKFIANGMLDYSAIINNKMPFCYECTHQMIRFLKSNNRTQAFMC